MLVCNLNPVLGNSLLESWLHALTINEIGCKIFL